MYSIFIAVCVVAFILSTCTPPQNLAVAGFSLVVGVTAILGISDATSIHVKGVQHAKMEALRVVMQTNTAIAQVASQPRKKFNIAVDANVLDGDVDKLAEAFAIAYMEQTLPTKAELEKQIKQDIVAIVTDSQIQQRRFKVDAEKHRAAYADLVSREFLLMLGVRFGMIEPALPNLRAQICTGQFENRCSIF